MRTLYHGDCLEIMPTLADCSVDAVITDPPYPEIDRAYGRLTEAQWWDLMMDVCRETRRILKPTGSAVFILQPNSRKVGSMRGWLWEFMAWVCRDWNMVQDVYWWNTTALPTGEGIRRGLPKHASKPCVWAGNPDCYRNRVAVLQPIKSSSAEIERMRQDTRLVNKPSNTQTRMSSFAQSLAINGGAIPSNVLAIANANSQSSSGAYGHGAGTPLKLADWWTRYIVPTGGTVLDPFNGAGTMAIAAIQNGCNYIGIEKEAAYIDASHKRIEQVQPALMEAAD